MLASLSGSVWIDLDGNFEADRADEAVEGALVWLDTNRNGQVDAGEPQARTSADGGYAFPGLTPGDYEVRLLPTPGLVQTSPSQYFAFYRDGSGERFGLAAIDAETGNVAHLTPGTGTARQGLVQTIAGEFYASEQLDDGIYRVDPVTGVQVLIGRTGKELVGGLAYDPIMDRIYTLAREVGGEPSPLSLYEVDRYAGSLARVGTGEGVSEERSISGMTFDWVNREVVLFDNNLDELLAYDLNGTGRTLSQFADGVGFYNLAFDGYRFLTFDSGSESASVYEVDVDSATLWPVRSLEQLVWADAADILAANQPWRVHLETESTERAELDFLTNRMNITQATLRIDESRFRLSSIEKAIDIDVALNDEALPLRFCVGVLASEIFLEQSLASSRAVAIETSPMEDRLTINASPLISIDMGAGSDVLVTSGTMQLNLPQLVGKLAGVDTVDLSSHDAVTLLSDAESIRAVTDSRKLRVLASVDDSVDLSLEPWAMMEPILADGRRLHQLSSDDVILELANGLGWRNPLDSLDVNYDGSVSPLDALLIINLINQFGSRSLDAADSGLAEAEYVDSSGDNVVSPIDVLLVINEINRRNV